MSFFNSEIVRAEMAEIQELQEEVYENVMKFHYMNNADKAYHIELLEKLIDKQKILLLPYHSSVFQTFQTKTYLFSYKRPDLLL